MYTTKLMRLNWAKMMNIKDCGKIVDNNVCPCADKLRRLYLKKPRPNESELRIQRRIEVYIEVYEKCYNE